MVVDRSAIDECVWNFDLLPGTSGTPRRSGLWQAMVELLAEKLLSSHLNSITGTALNACSGIFRPAASIHRSRSEAATFFALHSLRYGMRNASPE
jgi:hypothetical protein